MGSLYWQQRCYSAACPPGGCRILIHAVNTRGHLSSPPSPPLVLGALAPTLICHREKQPFLQPPLVAAYGDAPFWMAVYLTCSKHKASSLLDPLVVLPGTYTLGRIVVCEKLRLCICRRKIVCEKIIIIKKIHPQDPSVRNSVSSVKSVKSSSKRLVEFRGEDWYLLMWKEVHDTLLSEK